MTMRKLDNSVQNAMNEVWTRENGTDPQAKFNKTILYIGGNETVIDRLQHGFKQVYIVPSIVKATDFLSNKELELNALFCELDKSISNEFKYLSGIVTAMQLPLIAISNQKDKSQLEHFLKNGADDIFAYDFNIERLNYWVDFIKILKSSKTQAKKDTVPFRPTLEYKHPILKRLLDIVVSGTSLIILSPIMILIALAIKLESKGGIFYVSKRAGSGYRIFNFYKFRTMRSGSDAQVNELMKSKNQYASSEGKNAVFFKVKDDPRITKLGSFLRSTSLDELPQLYNVLKGDMSLVGNRPLPLYEAEQLTKDQWAMRFLAPAGITGLWQVTKRGKSEMTEEERIKLDMIYARKGSFLSDIKIILRTIPALVQKEKV